MVGAEKLFQLKKNPRLNSFLVRFFSLVPELFMKKLSKIMLVLLAMSLATTKSDLPLLLYFIQALFASFCLWPIYEKYVFPENHCISSDVLDIFYCYCTHQYTSCMIRHIYKSQKRNKK